MRKSVPALLAALSFLALPLASGICALAAAEPAQGRGTEDLTVAAGSYGISPSPPRLQDVLTINVTVVNQGTQNASSFYVAFYLNNTTTSLGRKTVSSLAQGSSTNVTASWDTRTTETVYYLSGINYTILVFVDSSNTVSEQDETNNNFTFNQSLGPERAPDLKLVGFTVVPPAPVRGETVAVEMNITNTGEIAAKFSKAYIFLDDIQNPISSIDVAPLNVSEFRNITLRWNTTGAASGDHVLLVYINPEFYFNRINELSWSDNNGSRAVTVARPEQALELAGFEYSPAEPHMGDMLVINCTIRNNGTETENFTAVVTIEGYEILNKSVGLEVGETTVVEADLDTSIYNPGNYTIRLRAGNIDRSMVVVLWPMRRADLVPHNVSFLPLLPKAGQTLTVSLEAANEGTAATNPCGVGLYADYLVAPVATGELPSLGPGESGRVNLSWNTAGVTAGSHWLRVAVDYGKVVVESNESNNNYVWNMTLDGDIDLVLENLTIRPASPRVGETVQFALRVRNVGTKSCDESVLSLKAAGVEVDSKTLGMVPAGGGTNATLKWPTAGMAAGAADYELAVQPSGGAVEARPMNNVLSGTLELLPPPPAPDLKVTAMEFLNVSPRAGDPLTIRVTIANSGNVDSGPSALMIFFVNGTALLRFTDVPAEVQGIAAGGSVSVDVSRGTRNFREGIYLVNATVDYRNEIAEQNESNNLLSATLELLAPLEKAPLLRVDGVSSDGKLESGASVSLTAVVSNTGEGDAYNVLVWFIVDGIHVGNLTLDQVKAGSNRTASYMWTPKEGTHTLSATAQLKDSPAAQGPQSQVSVSARPSAGGGDGGAGAFLPLVLVVVALAAGAGVAAVVMMRRKRPPQPSPEPPAESAPAPAPAPGEATAEEGTSWDR